MSDYSKIFASSPVNATAAKVVSQSGIHWEPEKQIVREWDVRSDVPIPTTPFSGRESDNLTGSAKGRLLVVGKARDIKSNVAKGAAWVVRCSCGYYEIKRTRSWKRLDVDCAMCSHCRHLEQLKLGNVPSKHFAVAA